MQSPFTGGHATLRQESAELTFRKEKFQYVHQFYECDETKELKNYMLQKKLLKI